MPSCAAYGCRSRPENGYRLFKLPSDPHRRQVWVEKMGRQNDRISSSAKLCEMHFLNDQFENKRKDGKKLLKWNAVPTEFSYNKKPGDGKTVKGRKLTEGTPSLKQHTPQDNTLHNGPPPSTPCEHTYASQSSALEGDDNTGAEYCCSPQITVPPAMSAGDCLSHIQTPLECSSDQTTWQLRNDFHRLMRRHQTLRASNAKLSKQLLQLKNRAQLMEQKLGAFLSKDQIAKLGQKSTRGSLWSRESVMSALKLKFSCGNVGYSALLGTRYPLPSARTLNRRLHTISFESGILQEAFDMLQVKVEHMSDKERLCSLALVEVPITPGFQHDKSTGSTIGAVSLPEHVGTATKGLVLMLGGVASSWKQTVAYYLINGATNGAVYKPILTEIITKAHSVGLHVCNITSDMEGPSWAMWEAFGVQASANEVVNRIIHPCHPQEFLYFCPDAAQLLKCVWAALLRHQVVYINSEHANSFKLPNREISIEHLHQVVALQGGRELKMAPHLTEEVLCADLFESIRPEHAYRLAGRDVTATMRCMVQFHGWSITTETTAWFLDLIHDWFKHMTSQHPVLALSKLSVEQYLQSLAFLGSVMDVFQALRFGPAGAWEPVQSAVLMATATVLQIQEDLLEQHHLSYILTARFSQDLAENVLSTMRMENPAPPALLFKQRLSSLAVSQYLLSTRGHPDVPQTPKTGSRARKNEQKSQSFAGDISDIGAIDWTQVSLPDDFNGIIDLTAVSEPIDDVDKWCLYNLGGYIITSLKKKHIFCKKCIVQVAAEKGEGIEPNVHRFVELKQFRDGRLTFPTSVAFMLLCRAEEMFRVQRITLKGQQNLSRHVLALTMKHSEDIPFLDCHEVKRKYLEEFLSIRQQISMKYNSRKTKHSSREHEALSVNF